MKTKNLAKNRSEISEKASLSQEQLDNISAGNLQEMWDDPQTNLGGFRQGLTKTWDAITDLNSPFYKKLKEAFGLK